jgi:hypothetical protein
MSAMKNSEKMADIDKRTTYNELFKVTFNIILIYEYFINRAISLRAYHMHERKY